MQTQRTTDRLPDDVRMPMGAKILKNRIKGEELTLMAKWVAFQVHHEKVLELFWGRNDFDALDRTWQACEPLGMETHLAAMLAQDIRKVGATLDHVPSNWSREQFGVAYLAWSLVKGCGISHAWPSDLVYCVHRQRQYCVSAGADDPAEEDTQLTQLFPWGAVLQSLDDKLYRETTWLTDVVLALRQRTINGLRGLHAELRDLEQRIDPSRPASVTLGHRSQTEVVRDFAHRELQAVLPEAERHYPKDRRLDYIAAFTAIAHDEKVLPEQEKTWLRLAKRTYRKQSTDAAVPEHRPTVFDYENTIINAINTADHKLEAFLQHHGYLK